MRYRFALVLLTAATPLLAQTKPVSATKPDPKSPDRIICKTYAPIGSLIPNQKECRTKRDWDAMRMNTSTLNTLGSCASAETGKCY